MKRKKIQAAVVTQFKNEEFFIIVWCTILLRAKLIMVAHLPRRYSNNNVVTIFLTVLELVEAVL